VPDIKGVVFHRRHEGEAMSTRTLYPDGYYAFKDSAGGEMEDGTVYYPAAINVHIGKWEAIQILRQIANSGLTDAGGEPYRLILSFSGTIERMEDD
jgi:hypothetical protein